MNEILELVTVKFAEVFLDVESNLLVMSLLQPAVFVYLKSQGPF